MITKPSRIVIIYLNQSSERNTIDIPGCSERTNFKSFNQLQSRAQSLSTSSSKYIVDSLVFHSCSLVFTRVPFVFTRVPFVFTRVPFVFTRVPFVFTRVPFVFTRVHSCLFVFTRVHLCSLVF